MVSDQLSKVVPFWEWKEKQKAADTEANGGVPLLRSKDWYHKEYGKYVAAIQQQGYASFNKGTLTVDVGQFLRDTRTAPAAALDALADRIESAAAPVEVELPEPAFRLTWDGNRAAYFVNKPNIGDTDVYTAEQVVTLARQLAYSEEANANLKTMCAAAEARAEQAESALAAANARMLELEAQRDDYLNREWIAEKAKREAERQLAAATRRVAEVEGLVGRWRQRSEIEASAAPEFDDPDEVAWHEGKASQLDECADELEAALQKEPK